MLKLEKVMKADLVCIKSESTMLDAYKLMYDNKIRHLPVLDKNHHLVGILSDRDVQRAMIVNMTSDGTQEISLNTTKIVSEFMSWPVYTVLETTPVLDVVQAILDKKISAVPIENLKGEWVGIISTDDLLKSFSSLLTREEELKSRPLSFYMPNILF